MATSAEEIKAKTIAYMAENFPNDFNITHNTLLHFIECIAYGVYEGMKNLEDNEGTPPASGHL